MNFKSFIDILFILLLAAIVMLATSVQLGGLDASPVKVGAEGVSPIRADEVQIVVVEHDRLLTMDRSYADMEHLVQDLKPDSPVLLVTGREEITHQRMMSVWSDFKRRGRSVELGVEPISPDTSAKAGG